MFFQPIFLTSKHPIEWQSCLEVVVSYLDAHAIKVHHFTPTIACVELVTLSFPEEQADWQAIASMLEQDFMTAMTILIGKPEYQVSSWEHQSQLLKLDIQQQAVSSFEQLLVEQSNRLSREQVKRLLAPISQSLSLEQIETIQALCLMNLNLSQAAKHLYIHRNTLNYRIDKLVQLTGIDVRTFYGAMTLTLAIQLNY
ncbi:MAG: PucR family transcriptional regulator [Culicoidibacterales bacterium]